MVVISGADREGQIHEALENRRNYLGPSFSTHYANPIVVRRGKGAVLFDDRDQGFIDVVNNPAGIGHCHPLSVRAASNQLAKLNTNTRYIYPELAAYARELCETLPEGLHVCYFVNSGSEANDLALRMAKAYTKQKDVVVVEGAYHGHTGAIVEISPYKFDGKGGFPKPATTHKVPIPCVYRGHHHGSEAGAAYAAYVKTAVDEIKRAGRKPAAWFCEGVLSTAGYIPLPSGYLNEVYKYIRDEGGICVSDEVQSGFGRVGQGKMWGFELQGVVPDIVTMGKPMGNGFPLAAVVTRVEIAQAFANGMEYFNTFGGGPVAMRVGSAVLQAIREDALLLHVNQVGHYMQARLRALISKHKVIGDVRGAGLMIGVELVRNAATKDPAPEIAEWIVESARARGVLLGTDGQAHNVLKVKPPLCISQPQIDVVVDVIDEVLSTLPTASPEALKALTTCASSFREVAPALARVQALIKRHGVGAGPTWEGHTGREEEESGSVSVTLTAPMNLVIGTAMGAVLAACFLRRP
jgi:4-aminobutyrate aminotransferase-like enzyme